jgi:hypothetical protein
MKVSFLDKLPLYTRLAWGAIVLFALMGVMLGKPAGTYVGIIAAVMWVLCRIIDEARASLTALSMIKKLEDEPPPADDAGDPPTTP